MKFKENYKKILGMLAVVSIIGVAILPSVVFGASISTLTDDFDDNSTSANWTKLGETARVIEQNRRLEINHPNSISYNYYISATTYDWTGSASYVEVVDPGNTGVTSQEAGILFEIDASNQTWLFIGNGVIKAYKLVVGVQLQIGSDLAYDPVTMRWLKIEESGGSWLYSTSPDGTTWTQRFSLVNPFGTATGKVRLYSQYWQAETNPNYAVFDNFNTVPSACDPTTTLCFKVWSKPGYDSFTPTSNVTAYVACWGGGGGGGDGTNAGGGGGGGGAYASSTASLTSGTIYTIFVGDGGAGSITGATAGSAGATTTFATTTVVASPGDGGGGVSAGVATGGTGGRTALSTGTDKFAGGNGGTGSNTNDDGGGGGGGAGKDGAGTNGENGNATSGQGGLGGSGDNGSGGAGGARGNGGIGGDAVSNSLGGGGGGGGDDGFKGGYANFYGGGGGGGEGNGGNGNAGMCQMYYWGTAVSNASPQPQSIFFFE